jgi:hypothetical protein
MAPQVNWPTASAKLIAATPSPVLVLIGETKRPSDWRAPIVTIMMPAAARVMNQRCGVLRVRNMGGPRCFCSLNCRLTSAARFGSR